MNEMNSANLILSNYANALQNMTGNFNATVLTLGENLEENIATVRTLNILLESIRSEVVIIQGALDNYPNE